MILTKKYLDYLEKWEGGDNLANLAFDAGGRTNKGITIATWSRLAPRLGYDPTLNGLLKMTYEQWTAMVNEYGKSLVLSGLPEGAAFHVFDYFWGSGSYGVMVVQKRIQYNAETGNLLIDGVFGPRSNVALKRFISANNNWYQLLVDDRKNHMDQLRNTGLPQYTRNYRGWMNRIEEFERLFRPKENKNV
jgi:lysozyme family protein